MAKAEEMLSRLRAAWNALQGKKPEAIIHLPQTLGPEKVERSKKDLRHELAARMRREAAKIQESANAQRKSAWGLPNPAPGVLPNGKMAMDQDPSVADPTQWAASSITAAFAEGQAFLGYPYLSELAQRPEYRVISQTWAEEMTRGWIRIVSTGNSDQEAKEEKIKRLEAAMKKFKVREFFRDILEKDGYFGRAHLYVDLGSDPNDSAELKTSIGSGHEELSRSKIRPGTLRGFKAIEAVWTYPNGYNANNPLRDDFYRPETWFVMGKEVHRTRLLTFIGRPVPDLLKPVYSFGGLSLSQMAKPYVDNWLRTRQSVSDTLSSFSTMILLTDLSAMLEEGAATDLNARADFYNATRDNRGLMLADKNDEDLKNVAVPLGTLDALQAQSQEQMSSVSQIPLVKFTGVTPKGLNASSEGELRVFYDKVKSRQEAEVRPNLETVIALVQLNEFGEVDPEIGFEFVPLWEPNRTEEANAEKTDTDAACALIDRGVLSPQEVRVSIANNPKSRYASLDTSEEALPELPEQSEGEAELNGGTGLPGVSLPGEDEIHSAAGVLLTCKGRALLLRRSSSDSGHPGHWDLPGGMLEPGEEPKDAALRELREEAGVELSPDSVAEAWHSDEGGRSYTVFTSEVSKRFEPKLSEEHDSYAWINASSIPSPLMPGLADMLAAMYGKNQILAGGAK